MFFLLFYSCIKAPINIDQASKLFRDKNCVEELKDLMKDRGCDQMRYTSVSDFDITFRCEKEEKNRNSFWDSYIFRASSSSLINHYNNQDRMIINNHTICNDGYMRIEAYPPDFKRE